MALNKQQTEQLLDAYFLTKHHATQSQRAFMKRDLHTHLREAERIYKNGYRGIFANVNIKYFIDLAKATLHYVKIEYTDL